MFMGAECGMFTCILGPLAHACRHYTDFMLRHAVPNGVLLIARLFPVDPSVLPPGQQSRLVGTTALTFGAALREDFPTLQPPDDAAYLSNMAVDPKLRRSVRKFAVEQSLCFLCAELARRDVLH
jgi:hypothetical protein